jgi:hypothetical protein
MYGMHFLSIIVAEIHTMKIIYAAPAPALMINTA